MHKTISVWLVVNDGENKGKIALQRRSDFGGQSFPDICQATWSGGIEDGENESEAMKRECHEELGEIFFENFDFSELEALPKQEYLHEKTKEVWVCYNFTGVVDSEILKTAELHNEALQDFVFVGKKDKIYPIKDKKNPKKDIVLFNDQFNILQGLIK